MSLLTAAQAVAQETGLLSSPSTVIGNTDASVVQLFALMKRACADIARSRDWEKLMREHTITTAASTEGYALPSDWERYIGSTSWDATNYWYMRGSLDPATWQAYKRAIVTPVSRKKFRVRGGQVLIFPTPTAIETLIIEYLRNTPWTDSTGATYRVIPTADTDLSVVPQHLVELETKWRLKREKGVSYDEDYEQAQNAASLAYAQDTPSSPVNYGYRTDVPGVTYPVIPQQIA